MRGNRAFLIVALVAIGIALSVLVLAALVTGPGKRASTVHVEPEVTFALPPAETGCSGATPQAGGGDRVPLTVSVVAGQVAETVDVCVGDDGPYPFIIDTGTGRSVIDAGLAHRLHLASAGAATEFAGVGCTGTARPVTVGNWSLDGVDLAAQQLSAATLPQMGGKDEPVGLLGSDVLSRFGGVRIDFGAGALVLPGPEGAPLAESSPFTGPLGPAPLSLTGGESGTTVPLTVTPAPGDVSLSVAVRFGSGDAARVRRGHRFVAERGDVRSRPRPEIAEHRPGSASGHGVLGDHGAPRPHRVVVRARLAAPSPAHRFHELRHHQLVGHARPAGLGPAPALRVGRPRLCRRPDGPGLMVGGVAGGPGLAAGGDAPARPLTDGTHLDADDEAADTEIGTDSEASPGLPHAVQVVFVATVTVGVLAGAVGRAWYFFHTPTSSDSAIVGLMADAILHGHFNAFYWGQQYGGVEPYAVAAVFAIFGHSAATLSLTPALLSVGTALVTWRAALRLVRIPQLAVIAGVLVWVAPDAFLANSAREGGFRGVTMFCGMVCILCALRLLDGSRRFVDVIVLGLMAGLGWWSSPEVAYFLVPAGLVVLGAVFDGTLALRQWLTRLSALVAALVVGALPWLWANVQSGFSSLKLSSFPAGASSSLNAGYWGRFTVFVHTSLPIELNLRRLQTGVFLFGGAGSGTRHAQGVAATIVVCVVLAVAVVFCALRGGRWLAVVLGVVAFPFLIAAQPGTWFWTNGQYVVFLGPLLVLAVVPGLEEAFSRIPRQPRRHHRRDNQGMDGRDVERRAGGRHGAVALRSGGGQPDLRRSIGFRVGESQCVNGPGHQRPQGTGDT